MKEKGFTLIELLAVIVIFGIISSVAVISYKGYIEKSKITGYETAEKTMKAAAESYFTYCNVDNQSNSICENIPDVGDSVVIDLTVLTNNGFMKEVIDQKEGGTCSGKVKISNISSTSDNYNLEYKICLKCSDYKSDECWY